MLDNLRGFIAYYKPYKTLFFTDMLCAFTLSGIDLIFPLVVRFLTNEVYILGNIEIIMHYMLLAGGFLLVSYIIRYFCQYYITSWGHIMGAKMEADMREDLFNHLQKMSFSYYDNTNTGKLMSRIVTDLFDISELAHHGPEDVFISLIKIIGSFIILFQINMEMTLILIFFALIMLVFSYVYNKKMRRTFRRNREKIANINAQIQDSLAGIRVVQSFSNEDVESQKFRKGNLEFLSTKEDSYYIMGRFFSGNNFFQGLLYLSVVLTGGYFIGDGAINVADLMVYILYVNIFLRPIEKLINFTEQFQRGLSGFERFMEVLHTVPEIKEKEDARELIDPRGEIEFQGVSFSYNAERNILDNIDIVIPAGKTIALVGPSGGGKTTFCSLIPRFYEISAGVITLDGIDIREIKLKSLRGAIGIVQQDVYLFSGTIKENIAYGKPGATDEEITQAAIKANIHDFIKGLKDGYDTYVGERGVRLSGGQKQRVSIARVFLKNPPVLILDEATSALDNESEKMIQKSLENLAQNRTTLVIAHRLSTIINADEIIVLTDEGIMEKGKHQQLLMQNGIYTHLYQS